jgi:CRP-like cAMP-binding protein
MAASREMQKRLKELAAALKADPGSIPRRLELAAALREADRPADAIELYSGVAEVYAEEGRLVQAMAVCKGILEIDREHRDTLEMLATLAQRRASRKMAAELKQIDGRWVAEAPAERSAAEEAEAATPPVAGPESEATPHEARDWRLEPDDDAPAPRNVIDEEVVAGLSELDTVPRTDPSVEFPLAAAEGEARAIPPAEDPALDFPPETKRLARGDRLLEFSPSPDATLRSPKVAPDELAAPEPVAPATEATRAATPRALEVGRAPSDSSVGRAPSRAIAPAAPGEESHSLFDDEPTGSALIRDVVTGPFPRPALLVEPPPFPLLSDLPRPAFLELLARLTVLHLDANVNVLREGEIGDACYLIASGSVRVTKAGVELAVLGPGAFFGEFAVLADQRRHASVETVDQVELLEIRRALIDELVAAHPGVARTLRRFYRERLLETLMATAPFFAGLKPEERVSIAERFRPRRFGRGARIIEEGAAGGGLFLILVGEVQVVRGAHDAKGEGEERELGRIGEGSYFGEMSLLRGGVASATVRASRMTEVVQLPPRDFYEVVSQHPILWEQLRSEAERRELANHAILTGEARKSGDGNIYLV